MVCTITYKLSQTIKHTQIPTAWPIQTVAWTSAQNVRWSFYTVVATMTPHNAELFSCSLEKATTWGDTVFPTNCAQPTPVMAHRPSQRSIFHAAAQHQQPAHLLDLFWVCLWLQPDLDVQLWRAAKKGDNQLQEPRLELTHRPRWLQSPTVFVKGADESADAVLLLNDKIERVIWLVWLQVITTLIHLQGLMINR